MDTVLSPQCPTTWFLRKATASSLGHRSVCHACSVVADWFATPWTPPLWQRGFFLVNCFVLPHFLSSERSGVVKTFRWATYRNAMHDSSTCPICQGQPTDGSMTDDEFASFLDGCRAELVAKQSGFVQSLSEDGKWDYDLANSSLRIGTCDYRITAIGTHNPELQTWLWAWANDTFPDSARSASSTIKTLFDVTGFRVFTDDGINATSHDAQALSACAIHVLGAAGLYRCPGEATLYLAVHQQ